jgi:hypothetical protein
MDRRSCGRIQSVFSTRRLGDGFTASREWIGSAKLGAWFWYLCLTVGL